MSLNYCDSITWSTECYTYIVVNDNNNRIERPNSRFFFLQSPTRTLKWPGRNRVQITCNTSSAYNVQHVMLRATWYEGTAQLLSLTEFNSHLFELYSIGWTINRWRRGGNRGTRRKPLATSFRKCHILKPEDASPKRDSNPNTGIGGRLGKQTSHVSDCFFLDWMVNVNVYSSILFSHLVYHVWLRICGFEQMFK